MSPILPPYLHQSLLELSDPSLVLLRVSIDFRFGIVQLVDAASGEVKATLPGDTEPMTALAFSPSGKRLYSASRSLQQQCWDVSSETQVRAWKGHRGPILAMDVDPTGSLLATASADASCRVWDTEGFYCTHSFTGHRFAFLCLTCKLHVLQVLAAPSLHDMPKRLIGIPTAD